MKSINIERYSKKKSEMSAPDENPWLSSSGLAAVLNPSSSTPGGPPPKPPDPPDPTTLSFGDFPPLHPFPSKPAAKATIHSTVETQLNLRSTTLPAQESVNYPSALPADADVSMEDLVEPSKTRSGSEITTVATTAEPSFAIIPPKHSSPIITNRASASSNPQSRQSPTPPESQTTSPNTATFETSSPSPPVAPVLDPPAPSLNPSLNTTTRSASTKKAPFPPKPHQNQPPTYAAKAKVFSDRSLKRLAPTTFSAEGKPRVLIPDAVFERGAALHKQYIVGSFLGKMPDYGPIQSVLNYMWGKGSKLEIHLLPLKHSLLVRVPNDYIRSKILEKKLWYVDTSMFYVSQWGSSATESYPEITTIPLWAHLRGIPFDLRTKEGLSHAAGLVGEPIETDDYTKNVSSLNIAHVKVEADLTKMLPSEGELVRQSGEIINVGIDYPWTPTVCTHCRRIGHIVRNCIYPPAKDVGPSSTSDNQTQTVNLQGYSPNVEMEEASADPISVSAALSLEVVAPVPVAATPVGHGAETTDSQDLQNHPAMSQAPELDSQAVVDFMTDTLLPVSAPLPPPVPPSSSSSPSLHLASLPPDPINHIPHLPAPSPPPLSPPSPSSSSPPPLLISSDVNQASVVVGLPAQFALYSNSYAAKKQALLFNSPLITLNPSFFDKSSASWKASTTHITSPSIPPPSIPSLTLSLRFLQLPPRTPSLMVLLFHLPYEYKNCFLECPWYK